MSTRRKVVADEPEEVIDNGQALAVKHRPRKLGDVLGQDAVVASLRNALKSKTRAHAYCFTGPSGCGKTTLARIIAAELGCLPGNVIEVDAASHSGIDAIKEVLSGIRYQGFGDSPNRAYIIDEAHTLSKQAWQALLKPIEEPPAHVYFFLCTTEAGKIPETIVTRCHSSLLKLVRMPDLLDLLDKVSAAEDIDISDKALAMVASAASGSPRQALTMLGAVQGMKDLDEIARVLESPAENKEIIDLCRQVIDRKLEWGHLVKTLGALGDMSAEGIRIVLVNYLAACLMRSSPKEAMRLLDVLQCFAKSFNTTDKMAPLLLAFGDLIFD